MQSVKKINDLVAEHWTVYHYTELITIIKPTETRLLNVHVQWLNFFYQTPWKGDNLIKISVKREGKSNFSPHTCKTIKQVEISQQ